MVTNRRCGYAWLGSHTRRLSNYPSGRTDGSKATPSCRTRKTPHQRSIYPREPIALARRPRSRSSRRTTTTRRTYPDRHRATNWPITFPTAYNVLHAAMPGIPQHDNRGHRRPAAKRPRGKSGSARPRAAPQGRADPTGGRRAPEPGARTVDDVVARNDEAPDRIGGFGASTPRENRTLATSVKGWRANRYTMGARPFSLERGTARRCLPGCYPSERSSVPSGRTSEGTSSASP
jgi:hypothetical protein